MARSITALPKASIRSSASRADIAPSTRPSSKCSGSFGKRVVRAAAWAAIDGFLCFTGISMIVFSHVMPRPQNSGHSHGPQPPSGAAFSFLRVLPGYRLLQDLIHPGLPARAAGLEGIDHSLVVADRHGDFGACQARAPSPLLQLLELFGAQLIGIWIRCNAAIDRRILFGRGHDQLTFARHSSVPLVNWPCAD